MKFAAVIFLRLLLLSTVAVAGPLDDGKTAFDRKDYKTALTLLLPLADQGNAEAQEKIGEMYEYGYAVNRNPVEAMKWLRLAADQGLVP